MAQCWYSVDKTSGTLVRNENSVGSAACILAATKHGEPKTGSMCGISVERMTGCSAIFLVKLVGPVKIALVYFILGAFHKGPVTHTITHVQRTKNWTISMCALWSAGRASELVDDCTRTPDERCSFIVCVNICAHLLHIQKYERFSTVLWM